MAVRTLGGIALAAGSILPRDRAYTPETDPLPGPRCFGCQRSNQAVKLVRFALEFRRAGQGGRGRKVGSLLLCERCWRDCR